MPRLPRISLENCLYYVTLKGNNEEDIFKDKEDYRMYLELLKKYKEQYGFKLFSFCLLPKQLNLLIELKEGSTISMVMHSLTPSYTKYFNNRYGRKGHLFQQRFKSVIVDKKPNLLNLISYMHSEPVRKGAVVRPSDYVYTSHLLYLYNKSSQEREESILKILNLENEAQEVLAAILEEHPEKKDYADFFSSVTQGELDEFGKKLYRTGILGSDEFVRRIEGQLRNKTIKVEGEKKNIPVLPVGFYVTIVLAGIGIGLFYVQRVATIRPKNIPAPIAVVPEYKGLTELNSTEWTIELKSLANVSSEYPELDKLTFGDGKITSKFYESKGFNATNYNLTVTKDNRLVWDTMQKNSAGQTLFWHGEVNDEAMQGTLSLRDGKNIAQDFSFTSIGYRRKK